MCRRAAPFAVVALATLVLAGSASGDARIYVPDYGSSPSSVSGYAGGSDGSLSPLAGSPFAMVPGPPYTVSGPMGLAFAPEGARAVSSYLYEGGVAALGVGAAGAVTPVGEPIVTASATGLAVSPNGHFAYVGTREFGIFPAPATPAEGIHAYSIGADGSLSEIAGSPFGGAESIGDLAMTPDGKYLFALRRDGSAIRRFAIGADGSLSELAPATVPPGGATQAMVSPDGRFLFVSFFEGEGGVVSYAIGSDGSLTQDGEPVVSGAIGLKYFDVAPDGRHIYLPDSATETVVTVAVAADGKLSVAGLMPLEGVDAVGVAPDGALLYYDQVSAGRIGVAKIGNNGLPTLLAPVAPWESSEPERIVFGPSETPVAVFSSQVEEVNSATRFDARASQRAAHYEWDFGDGTVLGEGGPTPEHVYRKPGTYRVKLTVSDSQGCSATTIYTGQSTKCPGGSQASKVQKVEVPPEPPRLRGLRVMPRRFKRSAWFRYRLSEAAKVKLVIQRRKVGRLVGGRCRRRTHANRKRRRCLRGYRRRGSPLFRHGEQGVNRNRFRGWVPFRSRITGGLVRRIKLSPGPYRVRAIAIDAQGNRSKTRSASFRILRR